MSDSPLETLVSVGAVQAQFGETFVEPELTQVGVWIERACAEMLFHAPALNAHLAAGTVLPTRVRGVGVDVVIRAVEDARIGHRVTSTEFPEIKTNYSAGGDEQIFLTAAELGRLQPTEGAGRPPDTGGPYVVSLSG